MKKIILALVFLLTLVTGSYGQVTVGEGTGTSQVVPFNPYYGYSYAQSIYLASEINANGSITSIQWYYNGSGALTNSQNLVIYMGQTVKTSFDSNLDFVSIGDLTQVYSGGIVTGSTPGWKTITLTTPFVYDGLSNLVVAVDESLPNWDSFNDTFRITDLGPNRSVYAYSDQVNINPADPSIEGNPANFETVFRGRVGGVPNIIFGGITQSCVNPTAITASNVTTVQATISWTGAAGQSDYEVYVVEQTTGAPTAATSGTLVTGATSYVQGSLLSNTVYSAYVRAKCSATLFSGWSGPRNFNTLCDPFGDFTEDFTSTTAGTGVIPNCWTKTIVSTTTFANVSVINFSAASAPNAISMGNSSDANAQIFLVSPALTAIGANTHRMKFKARGDVAGQLLIVGTMADATNPATFTPLQTITLSTTYTTYNVSLNTSTTAAHVAFRHGLGGTFLSIYLDDIIWEPIPTVAPGCIEDLNAVTNEGCGNFPTTLTWAAVPGADGYTVSIGTSPNGTNLVVNNVDIFSTLNYSFAGNPSTTYYYTVRPYNANGPAVNCVEDSFTTFDDGCYCVAVPTSIDANGVTNVQIGATNFPVTPITYSNLTENGAVEITRGVNTVMNVTLATGYSYATNVWIDFNDNFTFESSELVFTGPEGPNTIPTIVNTSFFTPLTAPLGEHRMRIVTTDTFQSPANPCYSGSWGVVVDLLVDVLPAPTCLPPSASSVTNITSSSAQVNWTSTGTLFNVEYDFAGFTQGGGTVVSGISGNSTVLSDLDPSADYAYYIQTNCGNGSLSPWVGPFTFRTACEAFDEFEEDFTTETNITVPECWKSLIVSTVSTPTVSIFAFNDYVTLNNSGNAAAELYLITPALTDLPLSTHRVKFKASSFSVGLSLVVGTMSDPANGSTFTAVQTIPITDAFANYSVSFLSPTTNSYVAFKFVGTAIFQSINIDDVIWEEAPSCPDINFVSVPAVTPFTATISWPAGGSETAWQYAYGLATVEDPSGLTPVAVTTTPSVTIPDLAPSTTYKVWVRAVCGSEFGIWSPATTFTTACVPVTNLPWTEGFEATAGTAFPVCWSEQNGDWVTSNQEESLNYVTPRTGSRFLRNSWAATNEFMWTPEFQLTAGVSYDFSFYMQADGFTGWTVDVFQNTAPSSVGATQLGGTTTASGTGTYVIQPYALITNTFVPTTTGTYYFAIRVNQPSFIPWYIAFDDFRLEQTPSCVAPAAPTATNITVVSATMNWIATTPAAANGYNYFITSDLSLTPNAITVPTGTVAAGITTVNLENLSASTVYRIFVRSICGETEFSSWSEAGTFTTNCVSAMLPYSINFENATTPNLPSCTSLQNVGNGNNWRTASVSSNGFSSKVLNYPWNGTNAANVWFYTNTVSLLAGTTYSISYQYGNNSTFYIESFKVAYGTSANAAAMTNEVSNHPTINQAAIQNHTASFTPTVSGDYVFGIHAYSIANQDQLYIDNILIQEVLSTVDIDNASFSAYPNPVKDVLNLSFTQNISQVAVYNLLGQQVVVMDMDSNKGQIDMSNMPSGTYLVKVATENAVKTIKVFKQ